MQVQRVCHSILPWLISFWLGAKPRFVKKRPKSVTAIVWILLVTSALSLLTSAMAINNPMAQELMDARYTSVGAVSNFWSSY
jgi:hypothetical protein